MPVKGSGGISRLAPVENANLHQRAYQHLRDAIMSGQFSPGETLTLRALATALGTSTIPARDAVLRLVAERALESGGRSVRVPIMSLDELRDVERLRILLEGDAAALAAQRATPAEKIEIERAAQRVADALTHARLDRFVVANQAFHFAVYRAARSDLLLSMIDTLWLRIGPHLGLLVRQAKNTPIDEFVGLEHHDALVAAIAVGDAEAARRALAADLLDSTDMYRPYRAAGDTVAPMSAAS